MATTIDGDRLVGQGLIDEVGYGAAVVQPHARPIGIKDAHDAGLQTMITMISHRNGLGEPLGLVIDATRADGVDVTPIGFRLGIHLRVAIDFRRGRQQKPRPFLLGQTQRIVRAQ